MEPFSFDKLSAQEREELLLCGITSPKQLSKIPVDDLFNDLESAKKFFPEKEFTLNKHSLQNLYLAALSDSQHDNLDFPHVDLSIKNTGPTTGFRHGSRSKEDLRETNRIKKSNQKKILHSEVTASHPILACFASLGTLMLIIPAISVFALPIMMVTNKLPDIPVLYLAIALIVIPTLPYLFISRAATCPVCHMRLFTFRNYARNRAAHHMPILGYNAATALHILFCLRYNCPGCGTPVKLRRKKGSRKHH